MTPIERAARALCKYDGLTENTMFEGKPMWMNFVGEARTVLTALREPDQATLNAAFGIQEEARTDLGSRKNARAEIAIVWRSVIDASLAAKI